MKNKSIYLVFTLIILIILLIVVIASKNNREENETINYNSDSIIEEKRKENGIKIEEDLLKQSIEKTQDGIKVSNAKIIKNENNIIDISLNVQNNNEENKIVELSVIFYNKENKEIGKNGFALGNMKAGEDKEIESNCYISGKEVENIKLETKLLNIEDNKSK